MRSAELKKKEKPGRIDRIKEGISNIAPALAVPLTSILSLQGRGRETELTQYYRMSNVQVL